MGTNIEIAEVHAVFAYTVNFLHKDKTKEGLGF